jgi:F420-dependent oxidoreductase-like protein
MELRFGVMLPHEGATWADISSVARRAEAAGFDSCWIDDHFLPAIHDPFTPYLESWSLLAAVAAVTDRLRVGTLVSAVGYRNPALLAKMATTVDHVSGGRLEFGIGAGWSKQEYREYGYTWAPLSARVEQLDEALHIARALWTEQRPTFIGKHYRIEETHFEPKPLQRPHPPIWIGGGEKVLPAVVKHASWWNFGAMLDEVPQKIEAMKRACDAAGRDPGTIGVSLFTRMFVAEGAKGEGYRRRGDGRPGFAGTPEQVAEQMLAYVRAGITSFCVRELYKHDMLELGATVIPLVEKAL